LSIVDANAKNINVEAEKNQQQAELEGAHY
jgi:hypothetical protein